MISNPTACIGSTDASEKLDEMGVEREELRKDVVFATHKVLSAGIGRSHLFRPYKPPPPQVDFKLVHRWPNLPGPVSKGVKFSSIALDRGIQRTAPTNAIHDKDRTMIVDSSFWMSSSKGQTFSKSSESLHVRRRKQPVKQKLAPALLVQEPIVKKPKNKIPTKKSLAKSWSETAINSRFQPIVAGSSGEPGPATYADPVPIKGPLPTHKRDDHSTLASKSRRLNRLQKIITSPFKCNVPKLASLDKKKSRFVKSQQMIEREVRRKHRRSEDARKLMRVRKKHAAVYQNMINGGATRREPTKEKFKPRARWQIPVRITDSYESPFHKITHKTRNFTALSPVEAKESES